MTDFNITEEVFSMKTCDPEDSPRYPSGVFKQDRTYELTVGGKLLKGKVYHHRPEVNGDYNLAVKGKMNMRVVKDFSIQGDSDVEIGANERFGGSLRFSSGQSLDLVSDLYVSGSINCDSLTAESRVNAGMGVYAGPFGFTSSLGGLSLGRPTPFTPVASPGCIDIIGSVTALGSVNAPVGNFLKTNVGLATNGISTSILGADLINDIIYNLHIHFTPKGPSSPTPTGMVA